MSERFVMWCKRDDGVIVEHVGDLYSGHRDSEPCPVCWGRVNDITPGAKCKNPACVDGRVAVPPTEGNATDAN